MLVADGGDMVIMLILMRTMKINEDEERRR
jgi:hypothetical protein